MTIYSVIVLAVTETYQERIVSIRSKLLPPEKLLDNLREVFDPARGWVKYGFQVTNPYDDDYPTNQYTKVAEGKFKIRINGVEQEKQKYARYYTYDH
jgi:hypothetical protein